jgi:xanthosine utilization system XapX-like protein
MMGGKSSKKTGGDAPPAQLLQMNTNTQFTADLSSYEAACMLDPDLQSFDATIQERTTRVISSLATGVEVRSLSFDSLREVTNSLLEMDQEVVKVILECKRDIWNNQDLFSLVEDYFENSLKTLDFCTALENCLKRTRDNQLIIQLAVKHFEQEVEDGVAGVKYTKTLQELRKFKVAGDPFSEEFVVLFQSVYKQHVSMLEKLQLRKRKLDKKLKSMKTLRRVANVIFVAAFVSVLIFSVVAAAIAAPPVVTALAGALAIPIGSVGKWCDSLWKRYENALKGQREVISSMQVGTYITMKDLESIWVLVNKLEIEIEALLENADFALREDEAVKLVMDEIKKKLEVFMGTVENLSEHADKCSRDIRRARTVILQRIIRQTPN